MERSMLLLALVALLVRYGSGEYAPSREIRISDLEYYFKTEEGRDLLIKDFKSVKGGQRKPWTAALLPENVKKNRYADLLPFDDTRVVLEPLPNDPNSDYINANYINDYTSQNGTSVLTDILLNKRNPREYVATQGPLPNTIKDFWRMIWQLNVTKIVMLANVFEHGEVKVEKYWPELTNVYGDIMVTKISHHEIPRYNHVIRVFSIQKGGITAPRIIRQYHYTGWPDMGVPEDPLSVVSLMLAARKFEPDSKAPIVVHCSAGVGRTGTMILIDSILQKASAEDKINSLKRLDELRLQRVDAVEKEEQYIFAHQAIYDYFQGNNTEEYLRNVSIEYRKMEVDYDTFASSKFSQVIEKMEWHNNIIRALMEALKKEHFDD